MTSMSGAVRRAPAASSCSPIIDRRRLSPDAAWWRRCRARPGTSPARRPSAVSVFPAVRTITFLAWAEEMASAARDGAPRAGLPPSRSRRWPWRRPRSLGGPCRRQQDRERPPAHHGIFQDIAVRLVHQRDRRRPRITRVEEGVRGAGISSPAKPVSSHQGGSGLEGDLHARLRAPGGSARIDRPWAEIGLVEPSAWRVAAGRRRLPWAVRSMRSPTTGVAEGRRRRPARHRRGSAGGREKPSRWAS